MGHRLKLRGCWVHKLLLACGLLDAWLPSENAATRRHTAVRVARAFERSTANDIGRLPYSGRRDTTATLCSPAKLPPAQRRNYKKRVQVVAGEDEGEKKAETGGAGSARGSHEEAAKRGRAVWPITFPCRVEAPPGPESQRPPETALTDDRSWCMCCGGQVTRRGPGL